MFNDLKKKKLHRSPENWCFVGPSGLIESLETHVICLSACLSLSVPVSSIALLR